MHTHIFGASSSPAVVTYALQKTADDNVADFSADALKTVKTCFYVDDCLKSVASIEKGIRLTAELRALTQWGGFRLTKWVSKCKELMTSIPESEWSKNLKNVNLDYESLPSEKALGVSWGVEADTLGFCVMPTEKPATKTRYLVDSVIVIWPLFWSMLLARVLRASQICSIASLCWCKSVRIWMCLVLAIGGCRWLCSLCFCFREVSHSFAETCYHSKDGTPSCCGCSESWCAVEGWDYSSSRSKSILDG